MKCRLVALLGLCGALGTACQGFAAGAPEGNARSVVNTGHRGAVRGLEFDEKRGLLFSSGDDGTVRIWDAAAGILERKLQVTPLDAERLAVNPVASQVAVVVTDGTGSFSLSVWDWEKEEQVFRVPLKEEPLFLRFSAMGSYLAYAESSWQSLRILRAADGTLVPFHPEGFGIVGFAEMSRSEKTVMTYQISGRIDYWDLETGEQTLDLPSVPYLSRIRISQDRRFLVGTTGSELVIVDTVTGAIRSRVPLAAAASLDISLSGDEIASISAGTARLDRWAFTGDTLVQRNEIPPLPVTPSLVCYGADSLFMADAAGGLHSISFTGEETGFGGNVLATITGIDAAQGLVALGSPDWIRLLGSDLLTGAQVPSYIRSLLAPNPFSAPAGVKLLSASQLLAWRTDNAPPALAQLDVPVLEKAEAGASFQRMQTGFLSPLRDLYVAGASLLGIESDGTVRLTDRTTAASRFDLRIPGVFAVVASTPTELIAGRNSAAAPGGSLLRVNTRTRETVSLKDRNALTYALLLDAAGGPASPVLYSAGIDNFGATNLVRHAGPGFEQESVLVSVREENLDVSLALDPDTHVLYATLARDGISAWDGMRLRNIPLQNTVPRKLVAREGMLFSLNRDSTVSVLESATGARLAEISLFNDGEWCALLTGGRYVSSPGGDAHVNVFQDGELVDAREDYRLRIDQ